MPTISTHVLDIAHGIPAQGMAVELHLVKGAERRLMAAVVTNADGRPSAPLVSADALEPGVYELSFHAADYFHRMGLTQPAQPFLGVIVIRVGVAAHSGSYHVPLLLSPFVYSEDPRVMTSVEQAREAIRWCRQFAECSEVRGETTRTCLSRPMREVHRRLAGWMAAAGMTVRVDAAGNIRGVYPSTSDEAPRFFIGSHLDTVPNAGAFDGVLGVVLGVALVEMLGGRRFPFSIEVVGFSDEEGVRFGVPFIGSRAFAGSFDPVLFACRDAQGHSLSDAIREYGLDPARLGDASAVSPSAGYLEFHIEQGPVLDDLNLPLAVVDAIVGQTRVDAVFSGMANHAGTTPMQRRRDALAGAAEWISAVEREAGATAGLVATVGRAHVEPGAGNVIPGRCELSLDVRHAGDATRHAAVEHLAKAARDIASRRTLDVSWEPRLDQRSVAMDVALTSALERAVEQAGFAPHRMSSGAGHDAMIVASRMPVAMLFVRCEGGISHQPGESVREEDVAAALEAGERLLDGMAQSASA